jgi:D-alanyl-D-alanine carboxypeptidase/D-alanyl-D-alanine-endopeptidase (penicillin-binding protein 4)
VTVRISARLFAAFPVVAAAAVLALGVPARAVDRSLGADVPKPTASGAPWTDSEVASLDANLDIVLAGAATLRGAHVGIEAIDARDGRILYERAQDDAFQPASTLKLLVGSAALDKLGPDFRFTTDAVAGGPIVDGTLQGALVVRAGGDPFLRDADFDALALTLAAKGVRTIRDGVAFDVGRFEPSAYPPGWSIDDMPYDYAPPVGALAFEENVVHLTISPGPAVDAPAIVSSGPFPFVRRSSEGCAPQIAPEFFPLVVTGAADAKDDVDVRRSPLGCDEVFGTIPLGAKPDTLDAAVTFPTVYASLALRAALQRHGIAVHDGAQGGPSALGLGGAALDAPVLWTHTSEPLRDVLADMWMPSDNLAAEMLLRELGAVASGGVGTRLGGIAFEKSWLTPLGADPATLALDDGSGLSAYDRITPADLVAILKHDWDGPQHDTVLGALPIAGVRGTLQSSFVGTPAEKRVFAKTGTLRHASTLAGYVATASHGPVIFAFLVDDWTGDAAALRDLRGRFLSRIVGD